MLGTESEVVVRTDDGQTLSVVQPDPAGLVPGVRVEVVPGPTPHLVRPSLSSPAS
jgi:outer membrane lipoprotein SlyB